MLIKDKSLTIPVIIDDIENKVNEVYQALPTRVFLVRKDGKLGVAAEPGPWGLAPGLKATMEWLAEYKKNW